MPDISHPQLNSRAIWLKAEADSHSRLTFQHPRRPSSAVSRDGAKFSGESLLLNVNYLPKISFRLTAIWVSVAVDMDDLSATGSTRSQAPGSTSCTSLLGRLWDGMTSGSLLKFKMADGEYCTLSWYCRATNVFKISVCTKSVFILFSLK